MFSLGCRDINQHDTNRSCRSACAFVACLLLLLLTGLRAPCEDIWAGPLENKITWREAPAIPGDLQHPQSWHSNLDHPAPVKLPRPDRSDQLTHRIVGKWLFFLSHSILEWSVLLEIVITEIIGSVDFSNGTREGAEGKGDVEGHECLPESRSGESEASGPLRKNPASPVIPGPSGFEPRPTPGCNKWFKPPGLSNQDSFNMHFPPQQRHVSWELVRNANSQAPLAMWGPHESDTLL